MFGGEGGTVMIEFRLGREVGMSPPMIHFWGVVEAIEADRRS